MHALDARVQGGSDWIIIIFLGVVVLLCEKRREKVPVVCKKALAEVDESEVSAREKQDFEL